MKHTPATFLAIPIQRIALVDEIVGCHRLPTLPAGCPVCVSVEQSVLAALDRSRFDVEVVHLGTAKGRLSEAEELGIKPGDGSEGRHPKPPLADHEVRQRLRLTRGRSRFFAAVRCSRTYLPDRSARMRRLLSNHDKNPAAVTSYMRQNCGHQPGTPGLEMALPWTRSKMPCAASATTTTHSDDLKPETASARKTAPTSDSRTIAWLDAPMTANRA